MMHEKEKRFAGTMSLSKQKRMRYSVQAFLNKQRRHRCLQAGKHAWGEIVESTFQLLIFFSVKQKSRASDVREEEREDVRDLES